MVDGLLSTGRHRFVEYSQSTSYFFLFPHPRTPLTAHTPKAALFELRQRSKLAWDHRQGGFPPVSGNSVYITYATWVKRSFCVGSLVVFLGLVFLCFFWKGGCFFPWRRVYYFTFILTEDFSGCSSFHSRHAGWRHSLQPRCLRKFFFLRFCNSDLSLACVGGSSFSFLCMFQKVGWLNCAQLKHFGCVLHISSSQNCHQSCHWTLFGDPPPGG